MVTAERVGEIFVDQSPPEFTHFLFANQCREIVESTQPLTIDQKTVFVKNFATLTGNNSSYNGSTFLHGLTSGRDYEGHFWKVASSIQKGERNQHISFADDDYDRIINLGEEEQTTIKFVPTEEGEWTRKEVLNDEETRKWLGKALAIYDKNLAEARSTRNARAEYKQGWRDHPSKMIELMRNGNSSDL